MIRSAAGHRFRSRRRVAPWAAVALVVLLLLARWLGGRNANPPPETLSEGVYQIERVVDGDTLLLANGARVRLIGVDTPETVKPGTPPEPWGAEASEFTRQFLTDGEARLQFDRERVDRYGRFLAYVYVGERMLNEELLRAGLARTQLEFNFSSSMKTRFRRATDEARAAGRGIWSEADSAPRANAA